MSQLPENIEKENLDKHYQKKLKNFEDLLLLFPEKCSKSGKCIFLNKTNKKYGANTTYYMPPCTPMAAANLGKKDLELIDIFIGKPGEPFIEILEPKWGFKRIGLLKNK